MLWWIIQNSAIAGLMAGVVTAASRLLRINPVIRHALWVIVLIKLVTPPMVAWPWRISDPLPGIGKTLTSAWKNASPAKSESQKTPIAVVDSPVAKEIAPTNADLQPPVVTLPDEEPSFLPETNIATPKITPPAIRIVTPPAEKTTALLMPRWLPLALGGAWAIGALFIAGLQGIRIVRMRRLMRKSQPADPSLVRLCQEIAGRLNMKSIPARVVPAIPSPAIWAFGSATLLWPENLKVTGEQNAIAGLVVHELAHVRRRDHWVGWLELFAACVWWWNPLFWYIRHQIRENAELACDAWVVDVLPRGRRAYAEALLTVCEFMSGRSTPTLALGAATGGRRFLERRLAMILKDKFPLRLGRYRLLAVGLIGLITLPAWSQKALIGTREDQTTTTATEPGGFVGSGRAASVPGSGATPLIPGGGPVAETQPPQIAVPGLPPIAQTVVEQYQDQVQSAHLEMDQKVAKSRQNAIEQLVQIQRYLDKAGSAEQSQTVQAAIDTLRRQGGAASAQTPLPDPGTLVAYRTRVGQRLLFEVTGRNDGRIWGSTIYTDDSPLAVTAVHAGLLKLGKKGVVRVTILPGFDGYDGILKNNIESQTYMAWPGSYIVEAVPPPQIRGPIVPYTTSSPPVLDPRPQGANDSSATELHSYRLKYIAAESAAAKVREFIAQSGLKTSRAPGENRQRVSFDPRTNTIIIVGTPEGYREVQKLLEDLDKAEDRERKSGYVGEGHSVGDTFIVDVVGSNQGSVWGDKVYTTDSAIGAAAVHAGLLKDGEHGQLMIKLLPGRDSYEGASHNGITSQTWKHFDQSFEIEGVVTSPAAPVAPTAPSPADQPK